MGRMAVLFAVGLALGLAPGASAQMRWRPYETVARSPGIAKPQVGMDAAGNATAIWAGNRITVASRPQGRSFGPPLELGPGEDPKIAVGPRGHAIIAWTQASYSPSAQVWASYRTAGGTFGTPQKLGAPNAAAPDVDIDAQGNALVAWEASSTSSPFGLRRIQTANAAPDGSLDEPVAVSEPGVCRPDVDLNAGGDALVAWEACNSSTGMGAAFRPAGEAFGPRQTVGFGGTGLRVGLGPDGEQLLLWSGDGQVHYRRGAAGALGNSKILDRVNSEPHVGVDDAGRAVAVWQRFPVGPSVAWAAKDPGADFGAIRPLIFEPSGPNNLMVSPGGRAIVALSRSGPSVNGGQSPNRALAALKAPGASFGAPTVLSDPIAADPMAAISDSGRAIVVYEHTCDSRALEIFIKFNALDDSGGAYGPCVSPPGREPVFTALDRTPPALSLSGSRSQKLGRTLSLVAKSTEGGSVRVLGRAAVRGGGPRLRRLARGARVASGSRPVRAEQRIVVRLRLSKTTWRRLKLLLRSRRRVAMKLEVRGRDRAGNLRIGKREVRIRR